MIIYCNLSPSLQIKECPCGHDANLWVKFLGSKSEERYLCYTKEEKDVSKKYIYIVHVYVHVYVYVYVQCICICICTCI